MTRDFRKLALLPAAVVLALSAGVVYGAQNASFSQEDQNHDGVISQSEATGTLKKDYQAADENRDGVIDQSEFSAFEARQSGFENPVVGPGGMGITEPYKPSRNE